MRFPKLPGRGADEAAAGEAQPMPQQHTSVITTVPIPESVPPPLTSELTRSIRFSISEPQGYFFEQVETFVQQVIEVLAFYEQAEYKWQQFAYEMQLEVDEQAHDAQRLRSEIELFKVQGSPLVNADGSYMTESQTSMLDKVSADLNFVKDQLSASEQARLVGQEEINRLQDLAAMRDQEIASLRAWGEQVIVDMQALQAHAASLEAQLTAAQSAPQAAPVAAPVAASVAPVEVALVEDAPVEVALVEVAPVQAQSGPQGEEGDLDDADDLDDLDDFDELDDQVPLVDVAPLDGFEGGDFAGATDVAPAPVAPSPTPSPTPMSVPVDLGNIPEQPFPEQAVAGQAVAEEPVYEQPVEAYVAPEQAYAEQAYAEQAYAEQAYAEQAYAEQAYAEQAYAEPEPSTPVEQVAAEFPVPMQPSQALPASAPAAPPSPSVAAVEPASMESMAPAPEAYYDPEPAPALVSVPVDDMPPHGADGPVEASVEDSTEALMDDSAEDAEMVWNIDSELPEGVSLPGTGEAAYSYPAASPGAPLETHGVPVDVWAPELDPRITQALAQKANQQAGPAAQ